MDDSDDDGRYPPSRRHPSSSSHRSPHYSSDDSPLPAADSSDDSRGKRRRLNNYEFAARSSKPVPLPPTPIPRSSLSEWSEESTFLLLDAWGERYVQNGRKSIRSDEWGEVAKRVCDVLVRTDAQCRNRLDTLKKKYRKEKARIAEGVAVDSDWVYFKKMDELMQDPSPPPVVIRQQPLRQLRLPQPQPTPPPPVRQPVQRAAQYVMPGPARGFVNRPNGFGERRVSPVESESEEEDEDESDGPPPRRGNTLGGSEASYRMLANSIQRFSELYERTENNRRQQMTELDRMRKEFQRDLEAHKRQILERAHVEIAKIREEYGDDEGEEVRSEGEDDNDDGHGSA